MKPKALKRLLGPAVPWLAGGALLLTGCRQTNLTERQAWVIGDDFAQTLKVYECISEGQQWKITNEIHVFWIVSITSNLYTMGDGRDSMVGGGRVPDYCESIGDIRIYVDDIAAQVYKYEVDHIERVELRPLLPRPIP